MEYYDARCYTHEKCSCKTEFRFNEQSEPEFHGQNLNDVFQIIFMNVENSIHPFLWIF